MTLSKAIKLLGTSKKSTAQFLLDHMTIDAPLRYKVAALVIINA